MKMKNASKHAYPPEIKREKCKRVHMNCFLIFAEFISFWCHFIITAIRCLDVLHMAMTLIKIMLKCTSGKEINKKKIHIYIYGKQKALMSLGKMREFNKRDECTEQKNDDSTNSLISFFLPVTSSYVLWRWNTGPYTYFTQSIHTYLSQFIVYIYFILCWYRVCIKRPFKTLFLSLFLCLCLIYTHTYIVIVWWWH